MAEFSEHKGYAKPTLRLGKEAVKPYFGPFSVFFVTQVWWGTG